MLNFTIAPLALGIALTLSAAANAAIIHVEDSAQGANNGTSWIDAFVDLKDALTVANVGDEVRIAQGTYKPSQPGHRDATFNLRTGVTIQGGYAGLGAADPDALDPTKYPTILSGDLNGDDGPNFANYSDNSYHVLTADGVDHTAVLRGVTIRGGSADYESYWEIDPRSVGGALTCINGGTATLIDCIVRENRAWSFGGGIECPTITLRKCAFFKNEAMYYGAGGVGGAVSVGSGASTIEDCTFELNYADNVGGACSAGPGTVFRRCQFIGNSAVEVGGAVAGGSLLIDCNFMGNGSWHWGGAFGGFDAVLVNCRFLNNGAGMNGGAVRGGNLRILNCVFSGNDAGSGSALTSCLPGGGCGYVVEVVNCTFVGNGSQYSYVGAVQLGVNSTVSNCIFWDNSGSEQSQQIDGGMSINHCIVQGWDGSLGGVGNSGEDPLMINPAGPDGVYGTLDDDPRLADSSPARDVGHNAALPLDDFDLDNDGNTDEPLPLDLDSLRRVVNNTVDIGAIEWQSACPTDMAPSSPGEAGDGEVSVVDLLAVITAWGECEFCAADVNADGMVNVQDLLQVISGWGTCR